MKNSSQELKEIIDKIEDICDSRIEYNLSLLKLQEHDREVFKLLLSLILTSSKSSNISDFLDNNMLNLMSDIFVNAINSDLESYEIIKNICSKITDNNDDLQLKIDYINFYLKSTVLVNQKIHVDVKTPEDFLETDYYYDIFNLSKKIISPQHQETLSLVGKTTKETSLIDTPQHYSCLLTETINCFNANKKILSKHQYEGDVKDFTEQLNKIIDIYKNRNKVKYLKESIKFNEKNKDIEPYYNPYDYAYPWRLLITLKSILGKYSKLSEKTEGALKYEFLNIKSKINNNHNIRPKKEDCDVKSKKEGCVYHREDKVSNNLIFEQNINKLQDKIDAPLLEEKVEKAICLSFENHKSKIDEETKQLQQEKIEEFTQAKYEYIKKDSIKQEKQEISIYAKILRELDISSKELIRELYSGNFSSNGITCKMLCDLAIQTGAEISNSSGTTIKIFWNKKTLHLSNIDELYNNAAKDQTFSFHRNKNSKNGLKKFYVNQFLQAFSVIFADELSSELGVDNWKDFCIERTKKFSSEKFNPESEPKPKSNKKKKNKKLK